jgi:hypothetical protein
MFKRLVAFATCGDKLRKRRIGKVIAEPLLAKVLMNPRHQTAEEEPKVMGHTGPLPAVSDLERGPVKRPNWSPRGR